MLLVLVSEDGPVEEIPNELEGVPVRVERRAPVQILHGVPGCAPPCHTAQLPAPVPMGVSGGWEGDNGGCTLGFKACDLGTGQTVFVTNSHCNDFPTCSLSLSLPDWEHPGKIDDPAGTRIDIGDRTGHAGPLCSSNVNLTDATKVASTSEETAARFLDLGWQAGAYTVVPGDRVEKSGRSTGATEGTVTAVSIDRDVEQGNVFCCGALTMTDQIEWQSDAGEGTEGGDSGSAVVVRLPNHAGSGDLFAIAGLHWGSDGTFNYANEIGNVLAALNLGLGLDFKSCFPGAYSPGRPSRCPPPTRRPATEIRGCW